MEQWQQEALAALLSAETIQVEEGTRVYVSSKIYGESRFHLLSKKYDGIQIEQINIDEKWGSRVNLQRDEIPTILSTLLAWHLETLSPQEGEVSDTSEDLDDLETHPF